MAKIKRSRSDIFIDNAPEGITAEEKTAFADKIESTLGSFTGDYIQAQRAMESYIGQKRKGQISGEPEQRQQLTEQEAMADYETAKDPNAPKTTASGLAGGLVRETAGPLTAAGIGALGGSVIPGVGTLAGAGAGLAAYGITEIVTPFIAEIINKYRDPENKDPEAAQKDLRTGLQDALTQLGVPEADTVAEDMFQSGVRGAVDATTFLAGMGLLKTPKAVLGGPQTTTQRVADIMSSRPGEQVIGGFGGGALAEGSRRGAQELGLGETGQTLASIAGGLTGDLTASGLARLGRGAYTRAIAKGMPVPQAQASQIQTAQGRGTARTTDIVAPTSKAQQMKHALAERLDDKGVFNEALNRENAVSDVLNSFGVNRNTTTADIVEEVAKDFYTTREGVRLPAVKAKYEVIDDITDKVSKEYTYEARPVAGADEAGTAGRQRAGTTATPEATPTGTDIVPQERGGVPSTVEYERMNYLPPAERGLATTTGNVPSTAVSGRTRGVGADIPEPTTATLNRVTMEPEASVAETFEVFKVPADRAVPTPKATEYIQAKIDELAVPGSSIGEGVDPYSQIGLQQKDKLAWMLNDWKSALEGKNLATVEKLREIVGESYTRADAPPTPFDKKIMNGVYSAIRDDMGEYIKKHGDPGDFQKWSDANDTLFDLMKDFDSEAVRAVLNSGSAPLKATEAALFNRSRDEVYTLYKRLSPEGQGRARSALLTKMAEESTDLGNLSPNQFARKIQDYGSQRGVIFAGDDVAQLEGLKEYLEMTQRAEVLKNYPSQGMDVGSSMPGERYAVSRLLWSNPLIGFGIGLTSKLGPTAWARHYESPAVRDMLIKLAQVPKDNVTARSEIFKRLRESAMGTVAAYEQIEE